MLDRLLYGISLPKEIKTPKMFVNTAKLNTLTMVQQAILCDIYKKNIRLNTTNT